MNNVTYLLPIWIDLECRNHISVIGKINQDLKEFFEAESEKIAEDGCSIGIQWSINIHIPGGEI